LNYADIYLLKTSNLLESKEGVLIIVNIILVFKMIEFIIVNLLKLKL